MSGWGMLAANVQRAQHPTQQLQVINRPAYGALVPAYSAAATDLAAALPSVLNGPTPPAMCDIGAEILRVPDLPLQYGACHDTRRSSSSL